MKKRYYTIKYPFDKSVFKQKFTARTIPLNSMARVGQPYGNKTKDGRLFFGEFVNDWFQIYTRPDMWDAILKPSLFIKRMPALVSYSRIYGIIHENDGQLVVDCTTDKMELAMLVAIGGIFMCGVAILACGISFLVEGFDFKKMIALILVSLLIAVPDFFMLRHHQGEEDALIKFMEDLKK